MLVADLGPYKGYEGASDRGRRTGIGQGSRGPVSAPAAELEPGSQLLDEELGEPQIAEPIGEIVLSADGDAVATPAEADPLPAGRVGDLAERRADLRGRPVERLDPPVPCLRLEAWDRALDRHL